LSLNILIRKTIRYSEYHGKLKNKFLIGVYKFFFPKGKDAEATKSYTKALFLLIGIGIINSLHKTGVITYDQYAFLYATGSLLVSFYIVLTYLNNSPEPTSFMVKLLGITLVTLLLVMGFVGKIALEVNESDYDNQRITEVKNAREHILKKEFEVLPEGIQYVLSRPLEGGVFQDKYELLFSRQNEYKLSLEEIYKAEATDKEREFEAQKQKIHKKFSGMSEDELKRLALEQINLRKFESYKRGYRNAGKLFTHFLFIHDNTLYEVGYSYYEYRQHTDRTARKVWYIIIFASIVTLITFPRFFRTSLVEPLDNLLEGVRKVNHGNLELEVPIKSHDEIGFLATSFNSMVVSIRDARRELQDYADNLEHKVQDRTREVQDKMEEVHKLKVQQDGDYFLTSLLAKPLFYNANKSGFVKTDFIIHQKKQFEFRNRKSELGGDICLTGNLRLGKKESYKRYTVAINGDAMGKSMQGAGGSLVMGVVMNSILARSAANDRILDLSPAEWLSKTYQEVHSVFKSFNGTMVISAVFFVVDDETGDCWYFNAEHPFTVLFRDGKASFIENDLKLRKLGLDSEIEFQVYDFRMKPGDVLILGSDGRDDINLSPNQPFKTLNEDEFLFLRHVEKGNGILEEIVASIENTGELTDDLSLLRIGFKEGILEEESFELNSLNTNTALENIYHNISESEEITKSKVLEKVYKEAKEKYESGEIERSIEILRENYHNGNSSKKIARLLGLLYFKNKQYKEAANLLSEYLEQDSEQADLWYYLSVSQKRIGELAMSINSSRFLYDMKPDHLPNLLSLSFLLFEIGETREARQFAEEALSYKPGVAQVKKLEKILNS
ncbi:MAG: SpoIIE family protein phosphatase, partial [Leptospiraceae bacterium]|nr:SpoIIE family protein phosphatase [Leptospiraceae bacterium]